jgi:Arc/MetJ-type ribon-helix-helix transcriptional regulator
MTTPKRKRLDGKKKLVRLSKEMEKDLRAFCRRKNIESESELVRQAIAKYIYADYDEETLKLQGIAAMRRQTSELRDMLELTFKYIRLTHINFLAYNAEIDPALADAAFQSATRRHDKFFAAFQDSLKNDPPFFERLLHQYFTGEADGQG